MPIYEYQCAACGRRHEFLQKVDASPLRDCPECGKPDLIKLVTAAGFRLAGSGWYETDFKTGNKRNLAGESDARSGTGKESASGKESGADKKPAGGKGREKSESRATGRSAAPSASE